jgi:hypothetical protein
MARMEARQDRSGPEGGWSRAGQRRGLGGKGAGCKALIRFPPRVAARRGIWTGRHLPTSGPIPVSILLARGKARRILVKIPLPFPTNEEHGLFYSDRTLLSL